MAARQMLGPGDDPRTQPIHESPRVPLTAYVGTFWDSATGATRVFTAKGPDLALEFAPGRALTLTQTAAGTFAADGIEYDFLSAHRVDERREGVIPPDQFVRLTDASRPGDSDGRFAGEFVSAELSTTYRIAGDGTLKLYRPRRAPLDLQPSAPLTFTSAAGTLLFERSAAGEITGFRLTTGLARRMYFRRR